MSITSHEATYRVSLGVEKRGHFEIDGMNMNKYWLLFLLFFDANDSLECPGIHSITFFLSFRLISLDINR